ncbi:PQQ-dependent sugar dehydrogenase [Cytobacillus sp. Hz8]|uniref:PQQ-dependent sugar dehydrogenase n=1 Tax=Cytobacillus sp. Hz8 TaxID=3347168 RepID=UPI0035D9D80E
MKKGLLVGLWAMIFLVGCSIGNHHNQADDEKETVAPSKDVKVIANQLQIPWAIAKIGDTFYISERTGTIVKYSGEGKIRQKVYLKKPLAQAAEAGLLGFVLSPDFQKNGIAYAYYTYKDESGQFNRIVTLHLSGNEWQEESLLLDRIPSGAYHHGGRLAIGPDGMLYATAGDAAKNPEVAQDLHSLAGKILRLNLDGSIPKNNPFPNSYVYSYGHRNPQGLTWAPDGTLYASEHGQSARDEINRIQKGHNYGWPVIQGDEKSEGMETPLFHSGANDTWAPSGMAYYNDKLYVATLRGNAVRVFDLKSGTTEKVITGLGRIRDVFIEGNTLYFISNNTDGRGTPDEEDDKLYQVLLEEL